MATLAVARTSIRGEFSLRGEILDVFPPDIEFAVRIVFEYDRIEQIRLFRPDNQRSVTTLSQISIAPCCEIIWDDQRRKQLRDNLEVLSGGASPAGESAQLSDDGRQFDQNSHILFPLAFKHHTLLTDWLSEKDVMIWADSEGVRNRAYKHWQTIQNVYQSYSSETVPPPESLWVSPERLFENHRAMILLHSMPGDAPSETILCKPGAYLFW